MSEATTYSRNAFTLWRRVGDEVLVANVDGSDVDRLSAPASAAWQLLEVPRTRTELTAALAAEFDSPSEEIERHVGHLLHVLERRGWAMRSVADA